MGDLGIAIREGRVGLGLKLREAADKWGLTYGSLSMIERGHRPNPTLDTIRKLAAGLGISEGELLDRANGSRKVKTA